MNAFMDWLKENGFAVVAHAQASEEAVYLQLESGRGVLVDLMLTAEDLRMGAQDAMAKIERLVGSQRPPNPTTITRLDVPGGP